MRFQKKTDCYLDTKTGLEWSLENLGPMPWKDAVAVADSEGWRLPTMNELTTLIDYEKMEPASRLPGMMSSYYWSATVPNYNPYYVWYVSFCYGIGHWSDKNCNHYVRPVRGTAEDITLLIEEAKLQAGSHPSKDARVFARNVFNVLAGKEKKRISNGD